MRQITLLLFGLLLLLSMNQEVTSQSKCYITTNGCSVPFDLPFIYKKTFTPACVKHDVCYSCGEAWGWKRSECDKSFRQDMYKLCETKIGRRKRWLFSPSSWVVLLNKVKRCQKYGADAYYAAVFAAGRLYWSKPSLSWCKDSCTKALGDPSKPLNG